MPFHAKTDLDRRRPVAVTSHGEEVRRLATLWRFEPSPDGGCRTCVALDLELRSKRVECLLTAVLRDAMRRRVATFESRARALYGRAPRARRRPRGASPRTRARTTP